MCRFHTQACSNHLAHHFSKQGDDGAAGMGGLLRLLVGMTPQAGSEGTSRSAAAAAARALTSAALHLQWDKLYLGAPVLMQVCVCWRCSGDVVGPSPSAQWLRHMAVWLCAMYARVIDVCATAPVACCLVLQAVQDLSGVDSAEQDLFASLAMCLAAVGAPDQELQALRCVRTACWSQPSQLMCRGILQSEIWCLDLTAHFKTTSLIRARLTALSCMTRVSVLKPVLGMFCWLHLQVQQH